MRTNEGYIDACAHPPSARIDAGEEENIEPPKKKLRSACKYRALNDAAKLGLCVLSGEYVAFERVHARCKVKKSGVFYMGTGANSCSDIGTTGGGRCNCQ